MKIELIFRHLLHWAWINLQSCFLNSQKNDFHKVQGVPLNMQKLTQAFYIFLYKDIPNVLCHFFTFTIDGVISRLMETLPHRQQHLATIFLNLPITPTIYID